MIPVFELQISGVTLSPLPGFFHSPLDLCDSLTLLQPSGAHFSSLLSSMPLYGRTTMCVTHSPIEGYLGCNQYEAIVSKAVVNICLPVFSQAHAHMSPGCSV